jgi:hypothetical protein
VVSRGLFRTVAAILARAELDPATVIQKRIMTANSKSRRIEIHGKKEIVSA